MTPTLTRRTRAWILLPLLTLTGCSFSGASNPFSQLTDLLALFPDNSSLAGLYSVTPGKPSMTVEFTAGGGGSITKQSSTNQLEALDADEFPAELANVIAQINSNISAFNTQIGDAVPDEAIITFPTIAAMRIVNNDERDNAIDGGIFENQFGFLGDFTGAAAGNDEGGGAILSLAALTGEFDTTSLTADAELTRELIVTVIGNQGAASVTVSITVPLTLVRTADVPADFDANQAEAVNTGTFDASLLDELEAESAD